MRFRRKPKGPSEEDLRLAEMDAIQKGILKRERELLREAEAEAYKEERARRQAEYDRQSAEQWIRQQAEWERREQEKADAVAAEKVERLRRGELPTPPPKVKQPPLEVFVANPMPPMYGSGHYRTMATGAVYHDPYGYPPPPGFTHHRY